MGEGPPVTPFLQAAKSWFFKWLPLPNSSLPLPKFLLDDDQQNLGSVCRQKKKKKETWNEQNISLPLIGVWWYWSLEAMDCACIWSKIYRAYSRRVCGCHGLLLLLHYDTGFRHGWPVKLGLPCNLTLESIHAAAPYCIGFFADYLEYMLRDLRRVSHWRFTTFQCFLLDRTYMRCNGYMQLQGLWVKCGRLIGRIQTLDLP